MEFKSGDLVKSKDGKIIGRVLGSYDNTISVQYKSGSGTIKNSKYDAFFGPRNYDYFSKFEFEKTNYQIGDKIHHPNVNDEIEIVGVVDLSFYLGKTKTGGSPPLTTDIWDQKYQTKDNIFLVIGEQYFDKSANKIGDLIIEKCLGIDDFIFGGFVRAKVENKKYNDIDWVINAKDIVDDDDREGYYRGAIEKLKNTFPEATISISEEIFSYNKKSSIYKKDVSLTFKNNTIVNIDLILADQNDPFTGIDFDINCLKIGSDGKITAAEGYDKDQILENIQNKLCNAIFPAKYRIDKFTKEGYTIVKQKTTTKPDITDIEDFILKVKSGKIKEEKTQMANAPVTKQNLIEMTKADAIDAGYRTGAKQISKTAKAAVLAVFTSKGMFKGKRGAQSAMKDLLDSPLGDAFVSLLMGYGINYIPGFKEDPRVQRLAKEFRVEGMSTAMNELAEVVLGQFLPEVTKHIQNLPMIQEAAPTKTRVTSDNQAAEEEHEAEEQAQVQVQGQKQRL